jgi:hypothetical protein
MVKNLFGLIAIGLLALGLSITVSASRTPLPSCNAPLLAETTLPITLDETQTYNMNDLFSGYNLRLTIESKP